MTALNTGPVLDSRRFVGRSNASIDDSPGERIDLVVSGNMLVYDVSCNEVNVPYEVDAGVLHVSDSGSSTAVACSADQDVNAPRFGELLSSQPTFTLTGNTVTISSSFGELELLDASAPSPEGLPLLGTEWRVRLVVTDETGGSMSMQEPPPVVRFSADTVQLVFGCRTVRLTAIVDARCSHDHAVRRRVEWKRATACRTDHIDASRRAGADHVPAHNVLDVADANDDAARRL